MAGRSIKSSWGKRQATLILYIFSDSDKKIKPKLIFHRAESGVVRGKEEHLYSPDVTVEFNKKAYNNEDLLLRWLKEEYEPLQSQVGRDFLLILDQASFHRTEKVLTYLKSIHTLPAVVPSHCTSLVQPLDTSVNKAFKLLLAFWVEQLTVLEEETMKEDGVPIEDWPLWRRRRLIT